MSGLDDQYAVLDGPHIEGYVPRSDGSQEYVRVPLVSHIEGNLYMGGCRDGVRLPNDFGFVLSLYPWEKYQLGPDTLREEHRLYDGQEVPDPGLLADVARRVAAELEHGHGKVLVHCQAGLNRSGLISALVLMQQGRTAGDAIALLREKRDPCVLCNGAFETWLLEHDTGERAAA